MAEGEDRRLLRACRRGDESAARRLYQRFAPLMRVYAHSLLGDEALAEDAVHNVFFRTMRLPVSAIDNVHEPAAWLVSLVRREALNIKRARRRRADRERESAIRQAWTNTQEHDELHAAIDALPRRLRETLILKQLGGLTYEQIGRALNLNRNTAASRHRRAIAWLRAALTDARGDGRRDARPTETDDGRDARPTGKSSDVRDARSTGTGFSLEKEITDHDAA